jgi:hypothetical protein
MRMIWMLFMLMVVVKATVAITERPRPLFDALHESGEAREVTERTRAEVAFFVEAVELVRRAAFVWMATRIFGGRNGTAHGYSPLESGHGRSVQERPGRSPKWAIHYGLSL